MRYPFFSLFTVFQLFSGHPTCLPIVCRTPSLCWMMVTGHPNGLSVLLLFVPRTVSSAFTVFLLIRVCLSSWHYAVCCSLFFLQNISKNDPIGSMHLCISPCATVWPVLPICLLLRKARLSVLHHLKFHCTVTCMTSSFPSAGLILFLYLFMLSWYEYLIILPVLTSYNVAYTFLPIFIILYYFTVTICMSLPITSYGGGHSTLIYI